MNVTESYENVTQSALQFPDKDNPILNGDPVQDDGMAEIAAKMHWYSSVVCGSILVIFGVIGNSISIIIWNKKSMRTGSTAMYLIAQAVNDIGALVFFFITESLQVIAPQLKKNYVYGVFHSYVGYPLAYFFVVNSIWTTVGVTVDRYIQVCWYTYAKALCRRKNATVGISLISLLCFLVNAPHFNTYIPVKPDSTGNDNGNDTFVLTNFGQGEGSQMYEFWVHCMFLVLVPWVSIFVLNMLILRTVYSVNQNMSESRGETAKKSAKKSEAQLTRILLSVTFCFLILVALQCITQCFFMMRPDIADMRIVTEAYAVARLGLMINCSINFLLYCLSGEYFRRELKILFSSMCGCRITSRNHGSTKGASLSSHGNTSSNTKTVSLTNSFDSM